MPPLRNDLIQHWLDVQNAMTESQVEIFGVDPINDPKEFTAEQWAAVGLNMMSRAMGLSMAGYQILSQNAAEFVPAGIPTQTVTTVVVDSTNPMNTVTTTTVSTVNQPPPPAP